MDRLGVYLQREYRSFDVRGGVLGKDALPLAAGVGGDAGVVNPRSPAPKTAAKRQTFLV